MIPILLIFLLAQTRPPPNRVSCIATNAPVMGITHDAKGKAVETEQEDWRIVCKISLGEQIIFNEALTTVHPETFADGMAEIDEFRKKRAPQLLKDAKHAKD